MEQHLHLMINHPVKDHVIASRQTVLGVGFNDAPYATSPSFFGDNVRCPAWADWKKMIETHFCFGGRHDIDRENYMGDPVDPSWTRFTKFLLWWVANYSRVQAYKEQERLQLIARRPKSKTNTSA